MTAKNERVWRKLAPKMGPQSNLKKKECPTLICSNQGLEPLLEENNEGEIKNPMGSLAMNNAYGAENTNEPINRSGTLYHFPVYNPARCTPDRPNNLNRWVLNRSQAAVSLI